MIRCVLNQHLWNPLSHPYNWSLSAIPHLFYCVLQLYFDPRSFFPLRIHLYIILDLSSMLPIREFLEFEYHVELVLVLPSLRAIDVVDAWINRIRPWQAYFPFLGIGPCFSTHESDSRQYQFDFRTWGSRISLLRSLDSFALLRCFVYSVLMRFLTGFRFLIRTGLSLLFWNRLRTLENFLH